MNTPTLESSLNDACDPILMSSESGATVWGNQAFRRFFGVSDPLPPLANLLSDKDSAAILNTAHYGAVEVTVTSPTVGVVVQTAVTLSVGAGDLEDHLFLVTFKSTPAELSLVKEKEHWLTSVAHDLKNPLSAIFSYADTLLDTTLSLGLSTAQRDIIARIRGTAARATDLVRNYQHMSQLDHRGVAHTLVCVDLNAAIHDVVNTTWRENTEKPLVVVELAKQALPARIDRIHLERVISNLFNNGVKFSLPESTISITSGQDQSGPWFSVHNFGPAIKPEEHDKMFQPFTRLSTSQGKPGTGLGLAIVKQIVDGTGSSITVESSEEAGTRFTVHLPADQLPAAHLTKVP
jgi:signal transduction histidine kinase